MEKSRTWSFFRIISHLSIRLVYRFNEACFIIRWSFRGIWMLTGRKVLADYRTFRGRLGRNVMWSFFIKKNFVGSTTLCSAKKAHQLHHSHFNGGWCADATFGDTSEDDRRGCLGGREAGWTGFHDPLQRYTLRHPSNFHRICCQYDSPILRRDSRKFTLLGFHRCFTLR
jgi:hypothetical protein